MRVRSSIVSELRFTINDELEDSISLDKYFNKYERDEFDLVLHQ